MAKEEGRRAVVQDPLAANPREQLPDRSLSLTGVRAPLTPSAASLTHDNSLAQAIGGIEGLVQQEAAKQQDRWMTEGKIAYQTGVAEEEMLKTGNRFTEIGYRTLQARDTVNKWFTQQTIDLEENGGKKLDPQEYAKSLSAGRESILSGITDPSARKVASAAFEEMSPRLASAQALKNNEFNRQERVKAFTGVLSSTAPTSSTASSRAPGQQLSLSPVPVAPVMQPSARDRDIGIRTILGEAANEGAEGQAAVAHVLRNRAVDSRWPGSIAGVALENKQFSAWNTGAGGNNLVRSIGPGHPLYERAGEVFDAVMSGKHVDPTGGATHYYSPAGMQKLVADGSQSNVIPKWLDDETAKSGGRIKIGGHIFVGKTTGSEPRKAVPETATSVATGTIGDLNTVPVQERVAVTGVTASGGQNEVQELIRGYKGLNDADKATAVADAMRRGLDAGDDTLFRDSGGMSILHRLGAKPGEVDEVIKAKDRFDKKRMTEFSVARETFRNKILERAEKGEDINVILADIDESHKLGTMNDTNARELAHSVADKYRQATRDKSKLGNPDMLNELGGLYQQIATGGDFKSIAAQGKAIAAKYGATEQDVQHIVGKMFTDSQTHLNQLRNEAKAAAKSKLDQDTTKAEVSRALATGYGLGNVHGERIKIVNDHGQPTTVSPEEYGVMQIKDKWGKQYAGAVRDGKMTQGQASSELTRMVTLELQNHGVVDKQTQAQLQGALAGNILDKNAMSGLKPGAVQAYDAWLTMKNTPGIRPDYLSKVAGDDYTRTLLETAFTLDSGDLSKEQALLKAHEILNDPNRDPNDKIRKDVIWKEKLDTDLKKTLTERAQPGFFARVMGTSDPGEVKRILTNDRTAENYVVQRAEAYHMQNPNETGAVSLEKALQDLQAHSVPVMGNLIISKPGKELDKMMGVSGFGPSAADDAMKQFVRQNGEKIWGKSYTDRSPSAVSVMARGMVNNAVAPFNLPIVAANAVTGSNIPTHQVDFGHAPPVHITYNAELGVVTMDLYKDETKQQTLGTPKMFFVKEIGAAYAKKQTEPTTWAKTWDSMFKGAVGGVKAATETDAFKAVTSGEVPRKSGF